MNILPLQTHTAMVRFGAALCSLALCVLIGIAPDSASAQGVGNVQGVNKTQIILSPNIPEPNTTVTARLQDYSLVLEHANIEWRINGEVVKQGPAATTYTFTTGPVGSTLTISATAVGPDGRSVRASRTLQQAFVGLVWEADTYVPPLYKGKALFSPMSAVRITAIPLLRDAQGNTIDPDALTYLWKNDYYKVADSSGLGKKTLEVENRNGSQPLDVTVIVSTLDGNITTQKRIKIPVAQPTLLVYELHPLRGALYERALLNTHTLTTKEMTLLAEPYYMSVVSRASGELAYQWLVGTAPVSAKGLLTVRAEGEGGAETPVSLVIRHTGKMLQSARAGLKVLFDTSVLDRKTPDFFSL